MEKALGNIILLLLIATPFLIALLIKNLPARKKGGEHAPSNDHGSSTKSGHDDHHDDGHAATPPKKDSHGHGDDHGHHAKPTASKEFLNVSKGILVIAVAMLVTVWAINQLPGGNTVPATRGAQELARRTSVVTTTEQSTSTKRAREIMRGTVPTGTEWLTITMVPNKTLFMCREDDPDCSQKTLDGVVAECRDVTFDVFRPKSSETCTGVREMRFQSASSKAVPVFWYFE